MGELKPFVALIDVLPFRLISVGHTVIYGGIKGTPLVPPWMDRPTEIGFECRHSSFIDVNSWWLSAHLGPSSTRISTVPRSNTSIEIHEIERILGVQLLKVLISRNNRFYLRKTCDSLATFEAIVSTCNIPLQNLFHVDGLIYCTIPEAAREISFSLFYFIVAEYWEFSRDGWYIKETSTFDTIVPLLLSSTDTRLRSSAAI